MKKLLIAFALVLGMAGVTVAQTTPAKKDTTHHHTVAAKPMKKDGTPDKRFKANKVATDTAVVHVKKDGTPDKRYKSNKKN